MGAGSSSGQCQGQDPGDHKSEYRFWGAGMDPKSQEFGLMRKPWVKETGGWGEYSNHKVALVLGGQLSWEYVAG